MKWTNKYGTIVNISDGLTSAQINKIKTLSNNRYSTKAQSLANSYAKTAGTTKAKAPTTTTAQATGPDLGITQKTGAVDPNIATKTVTDAAAADTAANFNMNNPGTQTDTRGNTQQVVRNPDGTISIVQSGGAAATAANQAFVNAAAGYGSTAPQEQAFNANYDYLTRHYAVQKQQETEAMKQELANRGIVYDPGNPNSAYGQAMKSIDDKYQDAYDQASNQAIQAVNQTVSTNVGALGTLSGILAQQTPQFTPYQGGQSTQGSTLQQLLSTLSSADLAKYQTDKDFQVKIQALAKSGGGGGAKSSGGGGTGAPTVSGGVAPGFDV